MTESTTQKRYREPWEFPADTDVFENIRTRGMAYVDKTDYVFRMTRLNCVFLSRPRRFGKSLLCSTLEAYFSGRKDLFEGLRLSERETQWTRYPIFSFNLSTLKDKDINGIKGELQTQLRWAAERNGLQMPECADAGAAFQQLIHNARMATGLPSVIIIDEYDAALLHAKRNGRFFDEAQAVLREFFITCKRCSRDLRFVFITGITKFSNVSIFSELNNLRNISLSDEYAGICGITEEELHSEFDNDIESLAIANKVSKEMMYYRLKWRYNGFHFSPCLLGVYNPFSLMTTLAEKKIDYYWFGTGTPSFLFDLIKDFKVDIMRLNETMTVRSSAFDESIHDMTSALPLFYQSGYLTIKDYDREYDLFTLGIPNNEVRTGLFESLMQRLTPLATIERFSVVRTFHEALTKGDVNAAMRALQAFLAGVPYLYEGKAILEDMEKLEALHQRDLYIFFSGMGLNLETEVTQATGRVDMVVWLPEVIYIFEFKMRGSADEALKQIDDNHYAAPYMTDPRPKIKVGVRFTAKQHTITSWASAKS